MPVLLALLVPVLLPLWGCTTDLVVTVGAGAALGFTTGLAATIDAGAALAAFVPCPGAKVIYVSRYIA